MEPIFPISDPRRPAGPRLLAAFDQETNRIVLPEHVRAMPWAQQVEWARERNMRPTDEAEDAHRSRGFMEKARFLLEATRSRQVVEAYAAYSMFEMMQPFGMIVDGTAVTAAAETILAPAPVLTVNANIFPFPGKQVWIHANGILSSVVTTPGTFTFRLRWGTGVVGDVLLMASGACAPDVAAHTSAMFWIDLFIKCTAQGPLATSLSLAVHGKVNLSSSDVTLAAQQALYMPAGNATQAIVTGLDGTINKTLTLTVQPSLTTGSVSLRDAQLIGMN